MKRNASGLSALVAINKPAGVTSHDVVNKVRRICGERRVGHGGTLDPAATGLLVLGVGPATRLLPYITGHDKEYLACIRFGLLTDTLDATGTVIEETEVPPRVLDAEYAQDVLDCMVGPQLQMPPAYSAKQKDGVRAYDAARKGQEIDLEPAQINIFTAQLAGLPYRDDEDHPCWNVRFRVSSGTYIRCLAKDVGIACNTVASLSGLQRLASGGISLRDAVYCEELEAQGLNACALNPVTACGIPSHEIDESQEKAVMDGKRIAVAQAAEHHVYGVTCKDRLLGVYQAQEGFLVAKTVIPGGVIGVV